MKYNKKLIFLIVCMVIFLLVGAISATKKNTNENISNVDMKNNTLGITSVDQQNNSIEPSPQQNNSANQSNTLTKKNLNSTINNETKINNTSSSAGGSFVALQNTINNLPDNSVLNLDHSYIYTETKDFTGIIISKNNFTIDGHGYTLDADSVNNIIY